MQTPQKCPKCGKSLADPAVPAEYAKYREQFTLAESGMHPETLEKMWQCPYCRHAWPAMSRRDRRRFARAR